MSIIKFRRIYIIINQIKSFSFFDIMFTLRYCTGFAV